MCLINSFDPVNTVTVDRRSLSGKYDQLVNRLARAAIPFSYGFFHIETNFHLDIRFDHLGRSTRGTFGLPSQNSYRTLEIVLSNRASHLEHVLDTFFHEMTHFWQMIDGRIDGSPAYYRRGRFVPKLYRIDPLEIEARSLATIMLDQYARYRSNYRWNVPTDVVVKHSDRTARIIDHRFPAWSGFP